MSAHFNVTILGGGPAGSAAALAAAREGSAPTVIERSRFPRHKVCGEFFSPEIEPALKELGVWDDFRGCGPARVERAALCFGSRRKEARLPSAAWGLSRYCFDASMMDRALRAGATLALPSTQGALDASKRDAIDVSKQDVADILACGRRVAATRRGRRQFGFKAHFEGPRSDTVELYFFNGCYVGVSPIEGGKTNVCGLGPEEFLSRFQFTYDEIAAQCPALADRLAPMHRVIPWITTGPLFYGQRFKPGPEPYPAGDALSFVDPFTGSGLLAAVRSGMIAGRSAVRCEPPEVYLERCRESLRKPFQVASLLRGLIASGWAERLAWMAPPAVLFALTRPR